MQCSNYGLYTPQIGEFTGSSNRCHSQQKMVHQHLFIQSSRACEDFSINIWVPTAKMDLCGYTMQQRQLHKNLSEALNQLASLRIVIVVFNMEQEAIRVQIDSW